MSAVPLMASWPHIGPESWRLSRETLSELDKSAGGVEISESSGIRNIVRSDYGDSARCSPRER
jgi:hypothetical protein